MAIFAISDLHLSFSNPKPMDIFGPAWVDHAEKLRHNWDSIVKDTDTVLLPGDLSWAMRLSDVKLDLDFIAERPGKKLLIRGNHDYWWQRQATSRIQRTIDRDMVFLQGTSAIIDNIGITGTRGWRIGDKGMIPSEEPDESLKVSSEKIFQRELAYLERGLLSIPDSMDLKIAMLHYPPFDEQLQPNEFAHLLAKYKVDILVYGHIHLGSDNCLTGLIEGVRYYLVSADIVDFTPQLIVP